MASLMVHCAARTHVCRPDSEEEHHLGPPALVERGEEQDTAQQEDDDRERDEQQHAGPTPLSGEARETRADV